MKLRVCFVIPTLDRGGAEKQLCLLASNLDRERFEPIVLVLTRTGPYEKLLRDSGIQVEQIDKKAKLDPFAWRRLRQRLKDLKPDIVHTWLFAANAYGRSAALSAGVPVILGSERSVDPWKSETQFWIDRWLAKRTHGLTANSPGIVDFYAQHGIDRNRFHVIPNGIDAPRPRQLTREQVCERYGISPKMRIVISIGRLWHQKGYKELIWSAELLRVLRDDICYVIIGDGPERERLESYRDNIKAAADVHLVGHREDAHELLPHCELLWNGSHYEGQSNVILEAMQAGVPVIASRIPGNTDLIEHEQTGLLFTLGNVEELTRSTDRLLHDPDLKHQLVENAKRHVEAEHSLSTLVRRHEEYYRSLVSSSEKVTQG